MLRLPSFRVILVDLSLSTLLSIGPYEHLHVLFIVDVVDELVSNFIAYFRSAQMVARLARRRQNFLGLLINFKSH